MDTSRVSFGEMIAAAGGLVLLFVMFLPWFDGRLIREETEPVPITATGWESFGGVFDLLIVVLAGLPIAIAAARAADRLPALPTDQGLLVLGTGSALFVIVAVRLTDPPDLIGGVIPGLELETSRELPAFAALVAAAAIAAGGYAQRRASAAGGIRTHKP